MHKTDHARAFTKLPTSRHTRVLVEDGRLEKKCIREVVGIQRRLRIWDYLMHRGLPMGKNINGAVGMGFAVRDSTSLYLLLWTPTITVGGLGGVAPIGAGRPS